jgi:hypothetical protein
MIHVRCPVLVTKRQFRVGAQGRDKLPALYDCRRRARGSAARDDRVPAEPEALELDMPVEVAFEKKARRDHAAPLASSAEIAAMNSMTKGSALYSFVDVTGHSVTQGPQSGSGR